VDPCLPRQHFKRAVTSIWGGSTPTTMGAQTSTTSTFTSTSVASSTVGGPVHALYARGPLHAGLTSVRPARQVFIPQPVETRGSTPRAWPGPGARCTELGTMETIWGDSSARSSLRPEFDRSQVASRPVDRAVDLGATGERYLSHGQGIGPGTVWRSDALPPNGYGMMRNATAEARQMYSAGAETGLVGLPPNPGVPVPGPHALEVGYEIPHDLRQPNEPSGALTHPTSGVDVQPRGTVVPCPVIPEDLTVRPWVRDPSLASGLSSFPATSESRPDGFIAEVWGTCQTTNAVVVSQCVVGCSGPPSTQPSQASGAFGKPSLRTPCSNCKSMMRVPVWRHSSCNSISVILLAMGGEG